MAAIEEGSFENNILDISTLPKFERVELTSLDKNYLLKKNIGSSIGLLFLLGVILLAYIFFPEIFTGFFSVIAVVYCLFLLWSFYSNYQFVKRTGFAIRERDVIYKRGFIFEKTTIVPYNRVQHVSTNRGLLDKLLKLSTVNIFTAGGSGSDVTIPGVSPETAEKIKETLSTRMSGHD